MMNRCFIFLVLAMTLLASSSHAFTASSNSRLHQHQIQLSMFSNDGSEATSTTSPTAVVNPLEVVSVVTADEQQTTIRTSTPVERPVTMARNMNTGEVREVNWVDPAMMANTNPLKMDWWAYPLLGLPFILLLNDALHFIPEDGPLSYLLRF